MTLVIMANLPYQKIWARDDSFIPSYLPKNLRLAYSGQRAEKVQFTEILNVRLKISRYICVEVTPK